MKILPKKENLIDQIGIYLMATTPLFFILPSLILNSFIIFISIFFLFYLYKCKNLFFEIIKIYEFKLIIIFWIILIFSYIIHQNFINSNVSELRTFGFVRYIIFSAFIFSFIKFKKYKYLNLYFKTWSFLLIIISFDIIFEYFSGKNIIGNYSTYPGRISSFTGDELIIGNIYFILFLPIIAFFFKKISSDSLKNKHYYFILIVIFFTICNFLIGERSNFIKSFLSLGILLIYLYRFKLKKIFFFIIPLVVSYIIIIQNNDGGTNIYYARYVKELFIPFNKGITSALYNSKHGSHFNTAYLIFKDKPIIGAGLKNFRIVCSDKKYYNENFKYSKNRCSTHPHQIHLEILSELGLVTYCLFFFIFLNFFKNQFYNFIKYKNIYLLASSLNIFAIILLPLPTGSFFSSTYATFFWFLFGLAISFRK